MNQNMNRSSQPAPNVLIQHNPLPGSSIGHPNYSQAPNMGGMPPYAARMQGPPMGQYPPSTRPMQMGGPMQMSMNNEMQPGTPLNQVSSPTFNRVPSFRLPSESAEPQTMDTSEKPSPKLPPPQTPGGASLTSLNPRISAALGSGASTYSSASNAFSLPPLEDKNGVALSRHGKEKVVDVIHKVVELFASFKTLDLPGTPSGQKQNKQMVMQQFNERLNQIVLHMERVYKVWDLLSKLEQKEGVDFDFSEEEYLALLVSHENPPQSEATVKLLEEKANLAKELEEKTRKIQRLTSVLRSLQWETGALTN